MDSSDFSKKNLCFKLRLTKVQGKNDLIPSALTINTLSSRKLQIEICEEVCLKKNIVPPIKV